MWFLQFCQSLENTQLSTWLRVAPLPFSVLLVIHVISIGLCGGVIAMGDLRVMGVVLEDVPVSRLFDQFRLWKWLGFASVLITGIFLTLSDPLEYHDNIMYWFSLVVLVLLAINGLVFHYGVYSRVAEWDKDRVTPSSARRFAVLSLIGWISLVFISRAIAFF